MAPVGRGGALGHIGIVESPPEQWGYDGSGELKG
jgi:hypothetical protein